MNAIKSKVITPMDWQVIKKEQSKATMPKFLIFFVLLSAWCAMVVYSTL
ncbi:hypothetical protein [Vibrio rarus]|nr:hypothetical protein [Vibrio rarus]